MISPRCQLSTRPHDSTRTGELDALAPHKATGALLNIFGFQLRLLGIALSFACMTSALADDVEQEFGPKGFDRTQFKFLGSREHIRFRQQGMQIVTPRAKTILPPTGVEFKKALRGDFEVTVPFEIVDIATPKRGYGVGMRVLIRTDSPTPVTASVARRVLSNGKHVFLFYCTARPANSPNNADPTYIASSNHGELQLKRDGSVLYFMVCDGQQRPPRTIYQHDIGDADVCTIQISADTGGAAATINALFRRATIRADSIQASSRAFYAPTYVLTGVSAAVLAFVLWRIRIRLCNTL